ncbi:MAK10-like protein [Tanacetum coccineum]
MRDENPFCILGDYSIPSHEGYRNTIELPEGNNVVPLRSDTIWLVQNGCSFHGIRSEDPNQHLKDFLKLMDSLDLNVANRERTRLRSISTWEDLTTHFLAQFFLLGRTAKLCNDILMFQQHQGESLSEAWTQFKDLLQKVPHHGIDLWLQVQIFYDHVNPATRRTIDQSAGGKLHDRNAKESWALLEDLTLYDNESWNNPRDFAKPVKAISLPQDVPSTSDRCLIELENQVERLMEAHLAPKQPIQVNKITSSCEICSVPTTLSTVWKVPSKLLLIMRPRVPTKWEVSGTLSNPSKTILVTPIIRHGKVTQTLGLVSNFMASQEARLSKFEADFKQQQSKMTNKIDIVLKATTNQITGALPSDTLEEEEEQDEKENLENINTNPSSPLYPSVSFITKKVCKLNSFFESLGLVPQSSNTEFVCIKEDDGDMMFIEIIKKSDDSQKEEPEVDLEREHTKSVYLRNKEDKRRGVEYVMSKLGFYKECLELGPEYTTIITDEGEVSKECDIGV